MSDRHIMWSGFITATDCKRVDAFLRRSKRSRFCSPDLASYDDLLAEADTRLFSRISTNSLQVLCDLLLPPSTVSQHYSLRERSHYFSLPYLTTHLADSNFIPRCLYNDAYWLTDINNYYNYMIYFFVFSQRASDRHCTYFIAIGSLHVSYVIVAVFCQLCLINIIIIIIIILHWSIFNRFLSNDMQ